MLGSLEEVFSKNWYYEFETTQGHGIVHCLLPQFYHTLKNSNIHVVLTNMLLYLMEHHIWYLMKGHRTLNWNLYQNSDGWLDFAVNHECLIQRRKYRSNKSLKNDILVTLFKDSCDLSEVLWENYACKLSEII